LKYANAQAFRQALEERIRRDHQGKAIPRVRKMIAFERLMARLDQRWVLKGGYAIQLRTERARTTQDVDLLATNISDTALENTFREALETDLGDYFEFVLSKADPIGAEEQSVRFQVVARVAGRVFERFHVDIGMRDPLLQPIDFLTPPNFLAFAQIEAVTIPCYSIYQHIPEKVHAIWQPRSIPSSRVKDLADLVLIASLDSELHANKLREAIVLVFNSREDQVPNSLQSFPSGSQRYNRLAKEIQLEILDYRDASQALSDFINPILSGQAVGLTRDPTAWEWK
jgi:hypothetical protein